MTTISRLAIPFQLSLRAALAAALAVAIAKLFRLQFPLYALVSAVLVTDLNATQTRKLGFERFAGTVLGAALGALIRSLVHRSVWDLGFGIFAAVFLCHLLHLGRASKLAGYVCGIVLLDYDQQPWAYALHRTVETVVGIASAVLVSIVPKLLRVRDAPSGKTHGNPD